MLKIEILADVFPEDDEIGVGIEAILRYALKCANGVGDFTIETKWMDDEDV